MYRKLGDTITHAHTPEPEIVSSVSPRRISDADDDDNDDGAGGGNSLCFTVAMEMRR